MNITAETLTTQLDAFFIAYPDFSVEKSDSSIVILIGTFKINQIVNDLHICESYRIQICIPLESEELPYVIDIDHVLDDNYHHYYVSSRKLCLEADCIIQLEFVNGFDLVSWMQKFVEPYFISYWYYQYTGEFPYGEREHGYIGLLQAWQDILDVPSISSAFRCLRYISKKLSKKHYMCPCGSGKRMEKCHLRKMREFIDNKQLYKIAVTNFETIKKEINNDNDL